MQIYIHVPCTSTRTCSISLFCPVEYTALALMKTYITYAKLIYLQHITTKKIRICRANTKRNIFFFNQTHPKFEAQINYSKIPKMSNSTLRYLLSNTEQSSDFMKCS